MKEGKGRKAKEGEEEVSRSKKRRRGPRLL
jgi:hypothetical protein